MKLAGQRFTPQVALLMLLAGVPAQAITINFDDQGLFGPNTFAAAGPAQTINVATGAGLVTFNGGVVLTNTTGLPANTTSLYGTAYFGDPSLTNPLRVTFENPITNFFLDVYNGRSGDVTYRVSDNIGNSAEFTLPSNSNGGTTQVGFAATGTEVTIEAITDAATWDFFIDNITFNEPLPTNPVPEPGTFVLLGGGLLGLALARRRMRRTAGAR